MDWTLISTSVLAGGIVGQILTVIGTHYFTNIREYRKWQLQERHKAALELIDVLTSNPSVDALSEWTHKIRNASLKIHILYENGVAPDQLRHCLEVVFRLAQLKKENKQEESWSIEFKNAVSDLRKQISININKK
jgi:hypothetical protein